MIYWYFRRGYWVSTDYKSPLLLLASAVMYFVGSFEKLGSTANG